MDEALWDRLAGFLNGCVEDFLLKQKASTIQPSSVVDYEIAEKDLAYLEDTFKTGNFEDIWYFRIARCKNINELPEELKKLTLQFLPRFFELYPEYRGMECLEVKDA